MNHLFDGSNSRLINYNNLLVQQVRGSDHVTATIHWTHPGFASGRQHYKLKTSERVLGVHIHNKVTWSDHAANVAKSFVATCSSSPGSK